MKASTNSSRSTPATQIEAEKTVDERPSESTTIDELHSLFDAQKEAFRRNPYPSLKERLEALEAIESMIRGHRKDVEAALEADFFTHPPQISTAGELLLVDTRSKYVRKNLEKWMKPESRKIDHIAYGFSTGWVMYQPVGVVGNMTPWNVPFLASLAPLVDILAAGNRAIIKPSEMTPVSSATLKEMVAKAFSPDYVTVVLGDVDLAQEFARMPWDHLLYTGNPGVGKLVMKAASDNLTPVTLELGGKCPLIIDEDSVNKRTVSDFLAAKVFKNGQTCIAPDYVFVPEGQRDAFISLCRRIMPSMFPSYTDHPQCVGIINDRHLDRLVLYLDDAKQKGANLVQLYSHDEQVNRQERKVPFTLVLEPTDEMEVMKNEIFGPIAPVKTYRRIDEAISYVNSHERPLALYFYTKDKHKGDRVLRETYSGGACLNAIQEHVLHPSMPFGGIGNSGMGRYNGYEGFKTFSNQRSVYQKRWSLFAGAFYPPYGKKLDRVINFVLKE